VAVGTIQRIFRDIGLARLRRTPKRVPRQMKLFEKAEPGESVQVDVKFVKIAGHWAFQYTALDDCTRFRVLRLYRRLHQSSSLAFLGELCRRRGGAGDPAPLHQAPAPATERQGRAKSSD
jgi:transposase-like protein